MAWYDKGIRFECQGSGKCCVSRGQYGYVYMNLEDRRRMAKQLKISTSAFTRKYCDQEAGYYHLKQLNNQDECVFLKNNQCTVYHGRPTQCRTWPFWPEVMSSKAWNSEVASYCPGVGKGKNYSLTEIKKILELQSQAEKEM